MKKRFVSLILVILLLTCMLPVGVFAETPSADDDVIYYDDGSYLVVSTEESMTRASGTKTGSRIYTYYNSSDVLQWQATLTGTFTYNGTTATCTNANCNISIANTAFYVVSNNTTRSGNTATATFVIGHKFLGVTVAKDTYTLTLSCDKNGNLGN